MLKTTAFEKYTAISKPIQPETSEKSNLIVDRKFGNLMKSEHSGNRPTLVNDVDEDDGDGEGDVDVEELDTLEEVSREHSKFIQFFYSQIK